MTQLQIAAYLSGKVGIAKNTAKQTLDELGRLAIRQLKRTGAMRLGGFGVFRKRKSKARIGRNPTTGQEIKIPARTRLRFTPAKVLKDAVLGGK